MITDILKNKKYTDLAKEQIQDQLMLLVELTDNFAITANVKQITFEPDIPQEIKDSFSEFTMFSLANYTFESIVLDLEHMRFEAGFGPDNIGAVVTIPYEAIFQIIVSESVLYINPSAALLEAPVKEPTFEERSKNAFTLNPKNKKFLD
jgi:hypothetical protein